MKSMTIHCSIKVCDKIAGCHIMRCAVTLIESGTQLSVKKKKKKNRESGTVWHFCCHIILQAIPPSGFISLHLYLSQKYSQVVRVMCKWDMRRADRGERLSCCSAKCWNGQDMRFKSLWIQYDHYRRPSSSIWQAAATLELTDSRMAAQTKQKIHPGSNGDCGEKNASQDEGGQRTVALLADRSQM